jgi:nitrite reductase/ring-hydroxylating ferredoxin subunit
MTIDAWQIRPNAPAVGTELGSIRDIADGAAREFSFGRGLNTWRMFVVRKAERVFGYVNQCPHYSLPLNHRSDEFLTRDGTRIICRQHLALFTIEDGSCVDGACDGRKLDVVPLSVVNDMIVVG